MKTRKGKLLLILLIMLIGVSAVALTGCNVFTEFDQKATQTERDYTEGLEFALTEDGQNYYVKAYEGQSNEVVVPSEFNHKEVVGIGYGAFLGRTKLRSIQLPDTITEIDRYAFKDCASMSEIVIPKNVSRIGMRAFDSCSSLTSFKMQPGNSYLYIETNLFYNCPSLITLSAPLSVINMFNTSFVTNLQITDAEVISSMQFSGNNMLRSLTIGPNVRNIESMAFANCENLTNVSVLEGVTSIGEDAFYNTSIQNVYTDKIETWLDIYFSSGHSNPLMNGSSFYVGDNLLSSLVIPEGTNTIKSNAFKGCTNITEVVIPQSLQTINSDAFLGCTGLLKVVVKNLENWCKIDNYSNPLIYANNLYLNDTLVEQYIVPDFLNEISSNAFSGCTSLKGIFFPNTYITVGANAFKDCSNLEIYIAGNNIGNWSSDWNISNCTVHYNNSLVNDMLYCLDKNTQKVCVTAFNKNLTNVQILSGINFDSQYYDVTIIDKNAFYDCTNLKTIKIPNEIEIIREGAFRNCSSLENIELSNNLTVIGNKAFSGCSILKTINLPYSIHSIGDNAFSETGLTDLVLPDRIQHLGEGFIANTNISNIKWPSSLTEIEKGVFRNSYLTTITLPSTLTKIGDNAFTYSYNLTEIILPQALTHIGDSAFSNCSSLKKIEIPSSVTYMGDSIFSNCIELESAVLPDGLENIPYKTFYNTKLTSIKIPANVNKISLYAFYNCSSLTSIEFNEKLLEIGAWAFYNTKLTNLTFPSGLSNIGEYAFYDCNSYTSVVIPCTVMKIGNYAFDTNTTIYSETKQKPNGWSTYWCDTTSITWAYQNVTSNNEFDYVEHDNELYLTNYKGSDTVVVIPNSIQNKNIVNIGGIFKNNTQITEVVLPSNLKYINAYEFYGCTNLQRISLPSTIISIGENAFYNCTYLSNIAIPENVNTIGKYAFYNCQNITSIVLPNNLKVLESSVFYNCYNLTSAILNEELTFIGSNAFKNCNNLTNVRIPDKVSNISSGAFSGCSELSSIKMPRSIKYIGDSAFSSCYALKNVYINNLTEWCNAEMSSGTGLFANCTKLYINDVQKTELVIPFGVTKIKDNVFINCKAITGIKFSITVKEICGYAFASCTNLDNVIIPKNIEKISGTAFSNTTINFYCEVFSEPEGFNVGWNDSGDVQYYGCSGEDITYSFSTNGGTYIPQVTSNGIIDLSNKVPTYNNYVFGGWYDNSSLKGDPVSTYYYSSNDVTLYAKWLSGTSFNSAISVSTGTYEVNILLTGEKVYYKFIPSRTGYYDISSLGSYDTFGYLYDSNQSHITSNDDYSGRNFGIHYYLNSGSTYYIVVRMYSSSATGSFNLNIRYS